MFGTSRVLSPGKVLMVLAAMCAGGMTITSCQGDEQKTTAATHTTPARSPSPTPSTSDQTATAIRESLRRLGTGSATLVSYENTYRTVSHYQVDCASTRPRSEFGLTTPGRQGQPEKVRLKIITDDSRLYARPLNGPMSKEKRPWYRGKISELDTNEFQSINHTTMPRMGLYLANCDQPGLLALFTDNPGRLAAPGTYKTTVGVTKAKNQAEGYAKDFYTYLKSVGVTKVRSTLWLDQGFRPTKYEIVTKSTSVPSARWVVSFGGWKNTPISVPPDSSIRS